MVVFFIRNIKSDKMSNFGLKYFIKMSHVLLQMSDITNITSVTFIHKLHTGSMNRKELQTPGHGSMPRTGLILLCAPHCLFTNQCHTNLKCTKNSNKHV